jgi:DNA-binding transcriptional LysR family regulator
MGQRHARKVAGASGRGLWRRSCRPLSRFLVQQFDHRARDSGLRLTNGLAAREAVGLDTLAMLERGEIHFGVCLFQSVKTADSHFGHSPMPPIELLGACHPSLRLERGSTIDVVRLASYPLLLPDASFAVRRTFDAVCNLARLKPDILIESRAPHTLLAFAEAGHGVAVIPSGLRTHRYALRIVRITYKGKPLREPLAVVWDKRRVLPRYASDFSELLAAHMRKLYPSLTGRHP